MENHSNPILYTFRANSFFTNPIVFFHKGKKLYLKMVTSALGRINDPSCERVKESAEARRGAASSSWRACTRTRPSLNLNGTLPWGWICVCRRCRCGSPSCGGPTVSSDDAVGAAPCFHDRDYRPRSWCWSDGHPRRCCSSGPPPADFYAHTHTTLFSCTPSCVHFGVLDRLICTYLGHTHTCDTYCSEPLYEYFFCKASIRSLRQIFVPNVRYTW